MNYGASLESLFQAYFDCRKNKRNTMNALRFETDYESNLIALRDELNSSTWNPGRSIAFVIDRPVKREIFAADFRDRVVHHWLINQLNPLFEKAFIYDSYASRKGRGAHMGIARADEFIRKCSLNYQRDSYVLKLDILSFFIRINSHILWEKLRCFIETHYNQPDKGLILEVACKVIQNEPTSHCFIKGKRRDWQGFPKGRHFTVRATSPHFLKKAMFEFVSFSSNQLSYNHYYILIGVPFRKVPNFPEHLNNPLPV